MHELPICFSFKSQNFLTFCFPYCLQIIAFAIAVGIIVHAGNHLTCDFPRLVNSSPEKFAPLSSDFHGTKPTYKFLLTGAEGVTGILMVILIAISFTLAARRFRRNMVRLPAPFNKLTGFNAFWYSHHLLGLVYVLLLIHGSCLYLAHKWYEKTVGNLTVKITKQDLLNDSEIIDAFLLCRHGCTSLFRCCSI